MSNPFAFFGLTPSLNIDEKALRKSYLDIQRGAHPDLAMTDQHEIEISELANAHYQVLLNPQTRVRTYLNVVGTVNWNGNQLPGNFLMEMMDLSDAIEEMDRSDVESMNEVESQLETYFTALNQELIEFQHQPAPDISMLGLWYQKSQYLNRLRKNFDGITEI